MAAFGGGPARRGGVCGILSGAAALVASLYGRTTPDDKWNPRLYELNNKLGDKFAELTEPHGGVDCYSLVGVDWRDAAQVRRFRDPADRRREVCTALVGDMAAYLGELLESAPPPG